MHEKQLIINEKELKVGKEYTVNEFILSDEGLIYLKQKKQGEEAILISPPIFISSQEKDYLAEEVNINLAFKVGGNYVKESISGVQLANGKLPQTLATKGFFILDSNIAMFSKYLKILSQKTPFIESYSQVGFLTKDVSNNVNELTYGLSKSFGKRTDLRWNQKLSPSDVTTKGSLIEWVKMVETEVLKHTPMLFVLSTSFASIIVWYLRWKKIIDENPIVHTVGKTTTGKSSAGKLAVSVFGNPATGHNSLYKTFNATENAFLRQVGGHHGVLAYFDEFSMSSIEDTTKIIYTLALGAEKGRMTDQLELAASGQWETVVLTNGEVSILEASNGNEGLYMRLFELQNEQWTIDAEHSEKIVETVMQNYGLPAHAFVDFLAKDWTIIETVYEEALEDVKGFLPASNFKDRIAKKYAIIFAALTLMEKVFKFTYNRKLMEDFILKHEKQMMKQRSLADLVYLEVIQDVITHIKCYTTPKQTVSTQAYGDVSLQMHKGKKKYRISVLEEHFFELLDSLKIEDHTELFKEMKKKPWFNREHGRNYNRHNIQGQRCKCYDIYVPLEELKSVKSNIT